MSIKEETVYHQKFGLQAEKKSPDNDGCFDHMSGAFHKKNECEKMMAFLKSMGFAVRMTRITKAFIVDETFPSEECDEEQGA